MSAYDPPVPAVSAAARDLDDRECAELDELLSRIPVPFEPMGVVALDGFLCGVLVQPVRIPVEDWLPHVFDTDARRLPTELATDLGIDRATELILRRHQALQRSLAEHGAFDPLVADFGDDDEAADAEADSAAGAGAGAPDAAAVQAGAGPAADAAAQAEVAIGTDAATAAPADADSADVGTDADAPPGVPAASRPLVEWVAGFHFATGLYPALEELDDDAVDLALMRIYRHLPAEDEQQRELQATIDAEMPLADADEAIDDLIAAVADIDDLTRDMRFRVDTVRRETPKVGRNDPCPCGSGKKYKRCHGADAA